MFHWQIGEWWHANEAMWRDRSLCATWPWSLIQLVFTPPRGFLKTQQVLSVLTEGFIQNNSLVRLWNLALQFSARHNELCMGSSSTQGLGTLSAYRFHVCDLIGILYFQEINPLRLYVPSDSLFKAVKKRQSNVHYAVDWNHSILVFHLVICRMGTKYMRIKVFFLFHADSVSIHFCLLKPFVLLVKNMFSCNCDIYWWNIITIDEISSLFESTLD